jgi:uncharacterized membrane protein
MFYRSKYFNDTPSNGGVISSTSISSGVMNNVFPNVTSYERTNGIVRYRKIFLKNNNVSNISLEQTKFYLSSINSGEDAFLFRTGTDTDTQSDVTTSTDWLTTGKTTDVMISGESSVQVSYKVSGEGVFSGEDVIIRITDGVNFDDLSLSGNPSWVGSNATLNFISPVTHNYNTNSLVCSMKSLGDIKPTLSNWTITSASGTFDLDTYPIILYNLGTVSDDWTILFTSISAFSVSGALTGSVGTGTIYASFSPSNASSFYFLINKDGWGGTWQSGDRITFTTNHAAKAVWLKEVVPAGASSISSNIQRICWEGEAI